MDNLLPPNATATERNLATANARLGEIPVPLRSLLRPAECPSKFLPFLAQQLSVDSWEADWSEAQKRDTVMESLGIHRVKGTIGAVRRALSAIGIGVRLQEWFNQMPAGDPYTYQLLLNITQVGLNQDDLAKMLNVVAATKNLRSHLSEIRITATSRARAVSAGASSIGSDIVVKHAGPANLYLQMEGAVNGAAPTEQAVTSIHIHLNSRMTAENYW